MPRKGVLGVMSDRQKRAAMAKWSPESAARYAALPADQKATYWFLTETKAKRVKRNILHRIGDWFSAAGDSLSLPNLTGK